MHICAPAEDVALPVGTEGEICVTGPNIMQAIRARAVAVVWCALPCLVMAASCQPTHVVHLACDAGHATLCVLGGSQDSPGACLTLSTRPLQGYWLEPEKTEEVIFQLRPGGATTASARAAQRCFRTGDLGKLSADGRLLITGRVKELFKLENGKFVIPAVLEDKIKLSRFIDQALLFGLNRAHTVVLLNLENLVELRKLLNKPAEMPLEALAADPDVRALVQKELDAMGAGEKSYAWPRAFKIVPTFSVENGLLTQKLSMKRNVITEKYRADLDQLYTPA